MRGVDEEGYYNKFFIEKDFDLEEIQSLAIANKVNVPDVRPLVVVRRMKFIDVTHDGNELYLNVESIVLIKRLQVNRCQVTLTTGVKLEIEYDAKRIRTKLEELDPAAFTNAGA